MNYIIFPFYVLFLVLVEACNIIYFRILAQYDSMKTGSSHTLFNNYSDFWFFLGMLVLGYFVFSVIKYLLLHIGILIANEGVHRDMIHGLVRSPASYFDITSIGKISNKYSNDLGIMDSMFSYMFIDSIEAILINLIILVNIFTINVYFLIPGVISMVFILYLLENSKLVIIVTKQLDLKLKSPVYSMTN